MFFVHERPFQKCLHFIYAWKFCVREKDDPQCYEHSFPSNEARANPRMDDDICWLSCCCLFSSFSRGLYLWPLRCFSLFSSKTKISKFLFDLIRSRTVEVGRTNYHYYYIVPLNHYLFRYLFSKKKIGSELQNQHA